MTYFKENPNLKDLQIVNTFDGKKEYRKNCKYIKEKYYTINRTCFEIEGKWRSDDSNIVFDWETKNYVLLNNTPNLIYGLIKDNDNVLKMGYFTPNIYNNIPINSEVFGSVVCISEEILGNNWIEDMKYHIWFNKNEISSSTIAKRKTISNHESPNSKGYNIEDNIEDFQIKTKNYINYNTHITPKIKHLSKYLGDISFGFEFELHLGNLPNHLQNRYGIVPCRDGSLNGGMELVTIPMTGAKGLQTIVNLTDDLKKRKRK